MKKCTKFLVPNIFLSEALIIVNIESETEIFALFFIVSNSISNFDVYWRIAAVNKSEKKPVANGIDEDD